KKFNSSLGLAYKTSDLCSVRFDAIFDQANDVGYPALPMDLWLSRALITSVSYKQLFEEGLIRVWDSKVYFNAIEHYMDDRSEEHTSELQSRENLVCRLLLEKKKNK